MLRWLYYLIVGAPRITAQECSHEWEIHSIGHVYVVDRCEKKPEMPEFLRYHLRCKKCGDMVLREMR